MKPQVDRQKLNGIHSQCVAPTQRQLFFSIDQGHTCTQVYMSCAAEFGVPPPHPPVRTVGVATGEPFGSERQDLVDQRSAARLAIFVPTRKH